MRALKAIVISGLITVTLASSAVLAQSDIVNRPARPSASELGAAQQALDDALGHLRKVSNPQNRENVRAVNFIKLAQQQLQSEGSLYPIN
jgi:hypothetical protein